MLKRVWPAILFFGVFFSYTLPVLAQEGKILVIESYNRKYPWDESYREGLQNVLGEKFDLFFFEMDTKRIPKDQFESQARAAFDTYKNLNPQLVILGDDNALKYVGPKLAGKETPVIYLGINQNPRNYDMFGPENITGILERPLMKRSVVYIKDILKTELKKILILFDDGTTSQSSVEQVFKGKHTIQIAGIRTDLQQIGRLSQWKEAILTAEEKGYGAVIVGLYQTIVDNEGAHVPAGELISWTSENTPVPPFGFWDFTVGVNKTVGGLVLFGKAQGEEAGKLALEILTLGKKPYNFRPVVGKKGRLLFSKSGLEKWKNKIALPDKIASEASFVD